MPVEGPRGEHGVYIVSDGTNRPWRVKMRPPSFMAIQALPKIVQARHDCRPRCGHRIDGRRDGRLRPVSFHPEMEYAPARFHRSERKLAEPGEPFTYTAENQAKFDEVVTRYPPDRRKSGDPLRAVSRAEPAGLSHRRGDAARGRADSAARPPKSRTSCRATRCSTRGRSGSTCSTSAARSRARCLAPSV